MSECVYTRAECHHIGTKCSECPLTDLICDEFTDCLDLSYEQGRTDAIIKYKGKLKLDVCARAQNSYKDMFNEREREIFNFATKTFLDALDYFAEQLKEE